MYKSNPREETSRPGPIRLIHRHWASSLLSPGPIGLIHRHWASSILSPGPVTLIDYLFLFVLENGKKMYLDGEKIAKLITNYYITIIPK